MNNLTKITLKIAIIILFMANLVSCNSSNEEITPKFKIDTKKSKSLEDPTDPTNPPPPVTVNL